MEELEALMIGSIYFGSAEELWKTGLRILVCLVIQLSVSAGLQAKRSDCRFSIGTDAIK